MAKDPLSIVKRAPKWAWFTVAGVGVGAGAIHLFRNRATADGDTPLDGGTNEDVAVTGNPSMVGGGNTPVIVPPVIQPGPPVDQSGTGLMDLQSMYLQASNEILDMFSSRVPDTYDRIYGPIAEQNRSITDNVFGLLQQAQSGIIDLASRAQAGPAPAPSAQGTYIDPSFAAAINRGDPNALAYVAAGAPIIDPVFAAKVAAGDAATLAFIAAHGG